MSNEKKAPEGASSAPPGQDPKLRQNIIRATQIAFPPVRDAMELILRKMESDNVPFSADGIVRAALGYVIAKSLAAGMTEEQYCAIAKETWPWFQLRETTQSNQDQNQGPTRLQS